MVYANFSSNLPTGLQHFEFIDLTIKVPGNWGFVSTAVQV